MGTSFDFDFDFDFEFVFPVCEGQYTVNPVLTGSNGSTSGQEDGAVRGGHIDEALFKNTNPPAPLETSSVVDTGETTTQKHQYQSEPRAKETTAGGKRARERDALSTPSGLSITPQPTRGSGSDTSGKKPPRKSTKNATATRKDIDASRTSKSRQPARKKVYITKEEAIASEDPNLIFCDTCAGCPSKKKTIATYKRNAELYRHIRQTHGAEPLPCTTPTCSRAFVNKFTLERHQEKFGHNLEY